MNSSKVIIVLLVILCAIFAYQTFFQKTFANIEKAYAAESSSNAEIITVPFYVNSNEQKIAVFKKETVPYKGNKIANQWCMSIYGMRDGRKLRLEASRWIENDFFLKNFNIYERRDSFGDPDWLYEVRRKGEGFEYEPKEEKKEEPKKDDSKSEDEVPSWFLNPSKYPGRYFNVLSVMTLDKPEELLDVYKKNTSIARREVMTRVNSVLLNTLGDYEDKIQDKELKEKYKSHVYNFMKRKFDIFNPLSIFGNNHLIQKDGKFIVFSEIRLDIKTIADILSDESMKEFEAICPEAKEAFEAAKKKVIAITENPLFADSAKPYLPTLAEDKKPS